MIFWTASVHIVPYKNVFVSHCRKLEKPLFTWYVVLFPFLAMMCYLYAVSSIVFPFRCRVFINLLLIIFVTFICFLDRWN